MFLKHDMTYVIEMNQKMKKRVKKEHISEKIGYIIKNVAGIILYKIIF